MKNPAARFYASFNAMDPKAREWVLHHTARGERCPTQWPRETLEAASQALDVFCCNKFQAPVGQGLVNLLNSMD